MKSPADIAARAGAGAIAGAAATIVMDAITELFYTEHIKAVEAGVSPRGAAQAVAHMLMARLDLKPTEEDATKAGRILHWAIGIGFGIIAGLFAGEKSNTVGPAMAATTAGMFVMDEFGLSVMGAVPSSARYPWQTNFRSLVGHASYGAALTAAYAFLRSLSLAAR